MALAYSKVTAQGQISVPVGIRRKLGIGPGSILEWDEDGDKIVVQRSARFTSEDIHQALPGSKLVIIPSAAHLSNLEQPDAFNQALGAFIDKANG